MITRSIQISHTAVLKYVMLHHRFEQVCYSLLWQSIVKLSLIEGVYQMPLLHFPLPLEDPVSPPPLPSPPRFPWATRWGLGTSPPSPDFSCRGALEVVSGTAAGEGRGGDCLFGLCWPVCDTYDMVLSFPYFQSITSPSEASSRWAAPPPPPRSRL